MTTPLPTEVAVRLVVGTEMLSGGTLVNGVITFIPQPREVIARTAKTGIMMQPVAVTVADYQKQSTSAFFPFFA